MRAFKKKHEGFPLPLLGTRPVPWGQWEVLAGVGSAASPLLLVHHPYPSSLQQDAGLPCCLPIVSSHLPSSSKALLSLMQAARAPSTVHTEHYTARQHLSSHLLSALKYVCKVSVCAVHAHRAKTCPSRPTQAPTMAAMTNHLSASLYPSPGGCCCFYSLEF